MYRLDSRSHRWFAGGGTCSAVGLEHCSAEWNFAPSERVHLPPTPIMVGSEMASDVALDAAYGRRSTLILRPVRQTPRAVDNSGSFDSSGGCCRRCDRGSRQGNQS
jgi:hypothetical protein